MLQSLISEINDTLLKSSAAKQLSILRRVTDLFVERADVFSPEQVAVFDSVIGLLAKEADETALSELSHRLALLESPPMHVVEALAAHGNIAVAGPLLGNCTALPDEFLAHIAATASRAHLQAIAARAHMGETVTDILVDRGGGEIARKLAAKPGARLSELGFVKLINQAKADSTLAAMIGARSDFPPELVPFLKLALTP